MNQIISLESFKYYLELPYSSFDCFDLVKLFYMREFSLEIPSQGYISPSVIDYKTVIRNKSMYINLVESSKDYFNSVDAPSYGDVILFRTFGLPAHVGIYIGNNLFLHTQKKTGACIEKLSTWSNKILGYYSHVDKT